MGADSPAVSAKRALGVALQCATKVVNNVGGRVVVVTSGDANLGLGFLTDREKVAVERLTQARARLQADKSGTVNQKERERSMLQSADKEWRKLREPQLDMYKELAVNCASKQVSVTLFAYCGDYVDLSSLGYVCQYTGGDLYHYSSILKNRPRTAEYQLEQELHRELTRPIALEAVLRFRASGGLKVQKII